MNESQEDAGGSDETLLEALARAEGDPELFPPDVLRLYREGKPRAARKALLRQVRLERSPERAAKQREAAATLRLWLEPIPNPPKLFTSCFRVPGLFSCCGIRWPCCIPF